MKKIFALLMAFVLLCSFCSCGGTTIVNDWDEIISQDDIGLATTLLPNDDYLNMFDPVEKYTRASFYPYGGEIYNCFTYFGYSEENYQKAYEFACENKSFRVDLQETPGDFTFFIESEDEYGFWIYPQSFKAMYFSEELHIIGFISVIKFSKDNNIGEDITFEEFIKMLFTEMNWDTGELTPKE